MPATRPFDVCYPRGGIVHRCKHNLGTGIDDKQNSKTKRTAYKIYVAKSKKVV